MSSHRNFVNVMTRSGMKSRRKLPLDEILTPIENIAPPSGMDSCRGRRRLHHENDVIRPVNQASGIESATPTQASHDEGIEPIENIELAMESCEIDGVTVQPDATGICADNAFSALFQPTTSIVHEMEPVPCTTVIDTHCVEQSCDDQSAAAIAEIEQCQSKGAVPKRFSSKAVNIATSAAAVIVPKVTHTIMIPP